MVRHLPLHPAERLKVAEIIAGGRPDEGYVKWWMTLASVLAEPQRRRVRELLAEYEELERSQAARMATPPVTH